VNTYLRMMRMVRPYTVHLAVAVVFMIVFSLMSVFSATMLSPFLETLFLKGNAPAAAAADTTQSGVLLQDEAGVPHDEIHPDSMRRALADGPPAAGPRLESDAERRARYDALKSTMEGTEKIKYAFKAWAAEHMLKGTKQEALLRICVTFFVLILLKNITCYIQEVLMVYVGQAVIRDLRRQMYDRMTAMPMSFFHRHKAGELISRATNDVFVAQQCVGLSFTKLVKEPIYILLFLAAALIISWQMTLLAFTLLPLSLTVIVRIGQSLRRITRRQQEQLADLTATLQETVYGIRVIKAFAMEAFERRRFTRQTQDLFRQVFRYNYIMKLSSPLTEQISFAVGLFLLWFGGSKVFTGGVMAPDLFVVFLFVIFSMVRPLKSLGAVTNEIQAGMAAAQRIFEVMDEVAELDRRTGRTPLEQARGAVEFADVHYAYVAGEPVLQGVSVRVEPGEVVALVGASGAGKSTLIDMIPGFYAPDRGRVLIDGHDIGDLDLASLRRNMGIVTQEVILFHDTVRANIAYGTTDAPLEQVRAAARAANADDFIMRLPDGYDTIIGDRGLKLSGGQRQRISIARAILRNPAILLLDEATSALDTESEKLVQEAIDRLVRDRTTIVIAHRLSTIQNADRIYVMEAGRVTQVGTHDELLAAGGKYKELYEMQFRG